MLPHLPRAESIPSTKASGERDDVLCERACSRRDRYIRWISSSSNAVFVSKHTPTMGLRQFLEPISTVPPNFISTPVFLIPSAALSLAPWMTPIICVF